MKPKRKRADKRTTVSLARVVWEMGEFMMDKKGFNDNFSAYVADLIRRDQEALLGKYPAGGVVSPTKKRATKPGSLHLNE